MEALKRDRVSLYDQKISVITLDLGDFQGYYRVQKIKTNSPSEVQDKSGTNPKRKSKLSVISLLASNFQISLTSGVKVEVSGLSSGDNSTLTKLL